MPLPETITPFPAGCPDTRMQIRHLFGIDSDATVPAYSEPGPHVPEMDSDYVFDPQTTLAILAGFTHNRRVIIQGYHGVGKSTHIEQVAARLHWPCVRINLDGQISRLDLMGRDVITLRAGKQVTEFQEGILPWAVQNNIALVLDEYDAGRPDILFAIQRVLEISGKLILIDQNRIITPHPSFRLFATMNTLGLGDSSGLYQGTQQMNQGQLDRWSIISTLDYPPPERETEIVFSKVRHFHPDLERTTISNMVQLARMTRSAFRNGDLTTPMSPRTVIAWAENTFIFDHLDTAFRLSFLNRCDENDRLVIAELYQRCFNRELQDPVMDTPPE